MVSKYSKEELEQMFRDGLISYTVLRDRDIRDKIASIPGKMSNRVKTVASHLDLSTRTIYRALKT